MIFFLPAFGAVETFRGNSLSNPWLFHGSNINWPCLTVAGSTGTNSTAAAGSTSVASCGTTSGNYQDSSDGWLRLSATGSGNSANSILQVSFPLASGFDVTFTYAMYGGTNPGDGIVVFLIDPTVANAGSGGSGGGGLGYCNIAGGILGIGLDAFGNFSNNTFCSSGQTPNPGSQKSNISVRAGALATPAWGYLGGTGQIAQSTLLTDSGWAAPASGVCDSTVPGNTCIRTGKRIHISFYLDTTCPTDATYYRVLVESITDGTTAYNGCVSTATLGTLPQNVQLGFAAGGAAATQYQEIRDITVTYVADLSITKTDGQQTYAPGQTHVYTIVATNNGPSSADGAVVTDAAPSTLNVGSVACTAAGGAVCPAAADVTAAAMQAGIAIPTLPAGGSVTFTLVSTVAAGASGSLTNTATIAPPASVTSPGASCAAANGAAAYDAATGACTATDTDALIACVATPNPAHTTDAVSITCQVDPGTITTIPNAQCPATPATGTSVTCTGTGAGLGNNPPATITDAGGNSVNTVAPLQILQDPTTPLPPQLPVCVANPPQQAAGSPVAISCTGGTPGNTLVIAGCSPSPMTIANPSTTPVACNGTAGTGAGQINSNPPVTVTDPATQQSSTGVVPFQVTGATTPLLPTCTANPAVAGIDTPVTITCVGGTPGNTITIPNCTLTTPMTVATPSSTPVTCNGIGGYLGNNPPFTVTDPGTNQSTDGVVSLLVNTAPPNVNPVPAVPVPTLREVLLLLGLMLAGWGLTALRVQGRLR